MYYLTLCIIVKNEDPYLKEWLLFHHMLGVEHFYIFDNESTVPVSELLQDIPSYIYTSHYVEGSEKQLPVFNYALETYGQKCHWMGFIDADEFAFPLKGNDLRPQLAEFEEYAGLALPWTIFGSAPHITMPQGLLAANYIYKYADTAHRWSNVIKCFVQPAKISKALDPHKFQPHTGHTIVNEAHFPVSLDSNRTVREGEKFQLNHYFFKSQQEYEIKLQRGRADRADEAARYPYDLFYHQLEEATTVDTKISRFLPQLEKYMLADCSTLAQRGGVKELYEVLDGVNDLTQKGEFEQAEALLCSTAVKHVYMPELWGMRSMLARSGGAYQRALSFSKRAYALHESMENYMELLQNFICLGQQDEALKVLNAANSFLAIHPNLHNEWKPRLKGLIT